MVASSSHGFLQPSFVEPARAVEDTQASGKGAGKTGKGGAKGGKGRDDGSSGVGRKKEE